MVAAQQRERLIKWLITGGAGFIGSNMAATLIERGHDVIILDDLSRAGSERNLAWLQDHYGCEIIQEDIRDPDVMTAALRHPANVEVISHQAAQVAVTTSVERPREDFEVNALGTLNVLEAMRSKESPPTLLFASTNKVYGGLEGAELVELDNRYTFRDLPHGISESWPLDFHSPYGCSKGCADQYVRDFARVFDLPTVVFRQSCIYGPRQFGIEDQGWVAWFLIASLFDQEITVYGDGKQARDLLFVDDLIDVYTIAASSINDVRGEVFNVGGGADNQLSLRELLGMMPELLEVTPRYSFADWRPGDQPLFVSDNGKAGERLGWTPKVGVDQGLRSLATWLRNNSAEVSEVLRLAPAR